MQTSFRLSEISSDSGKNTLNKEKKLASLKLPHQLNEVTKIDSISHLFPIFGGNCFENIFVACRLTNQVAWTPKSSVLLVFSFQ